MDWRELAQKSQTPCSDAVAYASAAQPDTNATAASCDGYASVVGSEAVWLEERDEDGGASGETSDSRSGMSVDGGDIGNGLAGGGSRDRAGACSVEEDDEKEHLRSSVQRVLQNSASEGQRADAALEGMSMGQ